MLAPKDLSRSDLELLDWARAGCEWDIHEDGFASLAERGLLKRWTVEDITGRVLGYIPSLTVAGYEALGIPVARPN